jgi:DNA repair protein RecO (recombination protein O)
MPTYPVHALVLRRIPLGEKDKLVTLFSRERGKLRAVGKGARKPTSKLAGGTEPLMLVRALLSEGHSLEIVSQVEVRESFPLLRGDYGLFLRATYACELLEKCTEERDPAPESFDLLLSTLYVLQRAIQPDGTLHAFELQLMAAIGYEPRLDACIRCDRPFGPTLPSAAFSAMRGGVLCDDCAAGARDETLPCDPATRLALIELADNDDARRLAALELPLERLARIRRILRAHLRLRLERDVRSTAFLDALRLEE